MKIKQLIQSVGIVLLLPGSTVWAGEYPAANFQPKVVYQDSSIVAEVAAKPSATGCEPSIAAAKKSESVEFDPKYPAANFQPKVVYSDAN